MAATRWEEGGDHTVRPKVAFVSFRLGGTDGVAVAAQTWVRAFRDLGCEVVTVAGEGPCDVVLPWLGIRAATRPDPDELADALRDVQLVVVENLLTIPLNVPAARAVADVLRGRPVLVHHHDPPWHRPALPQDGGLPFTDPHWRHVTISRTAQAEFRARGIDSTVIYNGFDVRSGSAGVDRAAARARLGLEQDGLLFLHPVRAIERKAVPAALAFAQRMGATYWLTGPAEDGYGPVLERVLANASVPVLRCPVAAGAMPLAYAAADCVLFPSLWEGFGNVPIEAALAGRPCTVGRYPVADELRELGFRWLDQDAPDAPERLRELLRDPAHPDLAVNRALARSHFSYERVRRALAEIVGELGLLLVDASPSSRPSCPASTAVPAVPVRPRSRSVAQDIAARLAASGESVSVCIPARNEASTVGPIVESIVTELQVRVPVVREVIVLDDGSDDETAAVAAAAGARVVEAGAVLPEFGPTRGKGDVLWRSLAASSGSLVVWCDADLREFDPGWVLRLVEPMLDDSGVALVKGSYERPEDEGGGGRVTELLARPLLSLLWPELAWVRQPLGGEYAGRRGVLEAQRFECDYGVEMGLLLDIAAAHGAGAVAEVDLGVRRHRHRPLAELHVQATSIASAMLRRCSPAALRAVPSGGRPLAEGARVAPLVRPPARSLEREARLLIPTP